MMVGSRGTMLAARAHAGERWLRLEEVPIPGPGPGDALVRVAATGLGPGPLTWWQAGMTRPLPVTPGHEIAGTVAEVGDGVGRVRPGDRVRVHANLTCRDCALCRTDRESFCPQASIIGGIVFGPEGVDINAPYHDGGLAEYVKVPAWLLDPLPDGVPLAAAARAHDVGVANRALKLAEVGLGSAVVVIAATGAMGATTVRLAPLFGVARVIAVGRSRARLERVRALDPGLVEVVALEELDAGEGPSSPLTRAIRRLAPGGADAVLDYLGDGRLAAQAAMATRNAASLVVVGAGREPLAMPMGLLMQRGLRLAGSRSCIRRDALEVIELVRSGRLGIADLVTHRIRLQDVNQAVAELRERKDGAWLITVEVRPEAGPPASNQELAT